MIERRILSEFLSGLAPRRRPLGRPPERAPERAAVPEVSVFSGRARRAALTAALAAAGLAVHLTIQRLAPPPIWRAGEPLVGLLPFLPWTVWIYLLFFPLLVVAGALQPAGSLARGWRWPGRWPRWRAGCWSCWCR